MHELDKIKEAKYFLSQILHEKENFENFKYNLSAFISSARSVLQYALEEAKIKNGGQLWYDGQIKGTKMVPNLSEISGILTSTRNQFRRSKR